MRTDFLPNRLFRYDGVRWVKVEDALRMTMSNTGLTGTTNRGEYSSATSYSINDAITYGGQYYVAIQAGSGQTPDSSPTYWKQVSQNWKTQFINQSASTTINGLTVAQRQSLTNALKPQADN